MFRAVELLERAAEHDFIGAHCNLWLIFDEHTTDKGIDKDRARAVEHYESAAKLGDVKARHNLGRIDYCAGNYGFAIKHWAISAKLGCKYSLVLPMRITQTGWRRNRITPKLCVDIMTPSKR